MIVSPTWGIRSAPTTKSRLMLPTTTMGFCITLRFRLLHHGCDRDRSQSKQKEDEHGGNQFARSRRSAGKFFPDEDAPNGRHHRRTLADCIGDCRTDYLCVGGNEVEHGSRTPDESADNSPQMPGRFRLEVLRHVDRRCAGERFLHEQEVHRDCAKDYSQSKEKGYGVWPQGMLSRNSLGHQRIKDAHEYAASNTNPDSTHADRASLALSPPIRECVENNCQNHERHAPEEQSGMALGRECVIQENAHHQSQADSDREGDSQASDVNGGNQKQVGHIEDSPAGNREKNMPRVCLADVAQKGEISSTPIS